MNYTFNEIREKGLLLYEYVRGSQAYGLALPTSDEDTGGVFAMGFEDVMGVSTNKVEQVADERNDVVWYEIGKFLELLAKANPTMLESLFVPERCIKYVHPSFKVILENRGMFVTKETFKSFIGYATSQIQKARGLNKKIVNPIVERKTPIDFCYTFNGQGTMSISRWLEKYNLKQIYCGLNHLSNMNQMYGVFYDYAQHIRMEYEVEDFIVEYYKYLDDKDLNNCINYPLFNWFDNLLSDYVFNKEDYNSDDVIKELFSQLKPKGYHGIIKEDGTSNQLHLDSIEKGDLPICYLSYNEDGYQSHCRRYKEFKEWEKKRNPQRYLENRDKEFDRKNMMHCVRLLTMGIEIAKTGKVNVDRSDIDREFLLNIRLGNTTYEEIISYADKKKQELIDLIDKCVFLPETVDMEKINKMLIDIRKQLL
jgi:predicted nucleotidyltransferase